MTRSCALAVSIFVLASIPALEAGAARGGGGEDFPVNACVAEKQRATARYCGGTLRTWAGGLVTQRSDVRDQHLVSLADALDSRWAEAEARSLSEGTDCSETTISAAEARGVVDDAVHEIVGDLLAAPGRGAKGRGRGVGQGRSHDAHSAKVLRQAGALCQQQLMAESRFIADPARDPNGYRRDTAQSRAEMRFARSTGGGKHGADPGDVADTIHAAVDAIVLGTTVSPAVPNTEFAVYSPSAPVAYQGRELQAGCVFETPYHFFAKRGSVNKLLMYYQGGGACWEQLTCAIPVCKSSVDPIGENPTNFGSGFADLDNPENPFRDWHVVVVSYCSCDVHYGDAIQDYDNLNPNDPVHAEHRGYQNAKIVEKWAREHFVAPEQVFATGSSAGSYGALFHGPGFHEVWPAAQIAVLGDAGNGVITDQFLQEEFENWNFLANLPPDIPGVVEAIDDGTGMVGYIDAVATAFPDTPWAHYSSAFDGGTGGQTGFYNVMLNDNQPLAALSWWNASCEFNRVMREQAYETAQLAPNNYRYYIGSGSRHTMWGSNKVYTDVLGGVPRIVDWVSAMLRSGRGVEDPQWTNVEADPFNVLLPGDVRPPKIPTLPFVMDGSDVVVDCP